MELVTFWHEQMLDARTTSTGEPPAGHLQPFSRLCSVSDSVAEMYEEMMRLVGRYVKRNLSGPDLTSTSGTH